ncbi:MAG: peptidylprolyl isomerase, partial [Bacteroidota bacterium]|nr:peptidylprolyl isomerase [Bacteroidota bacterium]
MSVIQSIRDKYARWAVAAIVISLLGFILMDAFAGRSSFGSSSTTIGKVNGREIDIVDFERKVKMQEEMAQQQGYDMGEAGRQQVIESVWNGEITQTLMEEQFEELGISIGKKEINDLLFGSNPPPDLKQRFTDESTGQYNALAAQQFINGVKSSGKPEDKAQLNDYVINLELNRKTEKYTSLLTNSIYYPKWFIEKQMADNNLIGQASYVSIPYSTISDSAVKVSDDEIKKYINDHKEDFEQNEETRSINYVIFNAAPTAADSSAVRTQVETLKAQFLATTDPASFLAQQGSSIEYYDAYVGQAKIQVPNKDSVFALPNGGVFGPYQDNKSFVLAKKIDEKMLPDSAKVRHILIQTANPQTGQVMLEDSTAKKRIDSIDLAINNGANFDTLAKQLSDDKGSADKGGVYDYFPQGQMVKAFNDFVFEGKTGDKKVIKTEFGYHLIEILGQKPPQPHYKIAYMAKEIAPSTETDNAASSQASLFAGESRDLKAFNANYNKNLKNKGLNKLVATDIKPGDYSITGLGTSRPLVKAIFAADKGDVIQPERVGETYVVATVTEINEEGLQGVNTARAIVEPILRNEKKADQIRQKLGKITTLEAAAAVVNQPVQNADSLRFSGANAVFGFEGKVIGAVFNPANKGKVVPEPIEGQAGVYILRVQNIGATAIDNANIEIQRQMMQMQSRQAMMQRSPAEVLKEAAD